MTENDQLESPSGTILEEENLRECVEEDGDLETLSGSDVSAIGSDGERLKKKKQKRVPGDPKIGKCTLVSQHSHDRSYSNQSVGDKHREPLEPSLYSIKPVLHDRFNVAAVRELVTTVMAEVLDGKIYSADEAKRSIQEISNTLCHRIRELRQRRYKHIVQVTIGEQKGAGCKSVLRCSWDVECDCYLVEHYVSPTLFAMVVVFGVYFY